MKAPVHAPSTSLVHAATLPEPAFHHASSGSSVSLARVTVAVGFSAVHR